MTLFDYQSSVEQIGMRDTNSLIVGLAPLFQLFRGFLFGIVLWIIRDVFYRVRGRNFSTKRNSSYSINPGGGNNRASQIAPNVFYGGFGVAFSWLGIDIETVFVFPVTTGLYLFERGTDFGFQFIEQGSAESIAEVGIVEVIDIAKETIIAVTTFRNKAVYVRVPLQISAKGVEYHDETGSKVQGLIPFKKQTGDNAVYGMEETVKEGTVIQEKLPELFINGKNTMTVGDIDQLKGHGRSALHGVEIPTGRAETAVAAERNKF